MREAGADVAEPGRDLGGADAPGARERRDDPAVRRVGDGVLGARGEPGDLADQGRGHRDGRAPARPWAA
jgi:hypothetical protein